MFILPPKSEYDPESGMIKTSGTREQWQALYEVICMLDFNDPKISDEDRERLNEWLAQTKALAEVSALKEEMDKPLPSSN